MRLAPFDPLSVLTIEEYVATLIEIFAVLAMRGNDHGKAESLRTRDL